MKYYLMPHPFKENEDVLFGNVGFASNGTDFDLEHSLWKQYHDPEKDIPVIRRTVITNKEVFNENLESLVEDYEKGINKNNLDKISKDKFKVYSRLGAGLSASYLLYFCMPEAVINTINQFSGAIGNSLVGDLAKLSLCAIPAVFSVVKNVGIPIVGSLLGVGKKRSKIYILNNKEKTLKGENKFISLFNSPIKDRVVKDMYKVADNIKAKSNNKKVIKTLTSCIKNIEEEDNDREDEWDNKFTVVKDMYKTVDNSKAKPNKEVIKTLTSYTKNIGEEDNDREDEWDNKFNGLIESAERDEQFPWEEIEQLKDMQKNVLGHMKNNFRFAPLEVITPNSQEKGKEAYIKQAQNLKEFLRNPASQKIRNRVYTTYKELKNTGSKEKVLECMTNLTKDFEKLYGHIARYDFGDTTNQNDRGLLKEFYYNLYVKFGKTTEKLRKEKCKIK